MRQCASPVLWRDGKMIEHRGSRCPDRRCQREGKYGFIITPSGRVLWFCYGHFSTWERHYLIVDRILSIPSRDILG